MNFIDNALLKAKTKLFFLVNDFKNEESGVSSLVATVLLIVMVVALAAVLWGFLSGWFEDLFKQIEEGAAGIGN